MKLYKNKRIRSVEEINLNVQKDLDRMKNLELLESKIFNNKK